MREIQGEATLGAKKKYSIVVTVGVCMCLHKFYVINVIGSEQNRMIV